MGSFASRRLGDCMEDKIWKILSSFGYLIVLALITFGMIWLMSFILRVFHVMFA